MARTSMAWLLARLRRMVNDGDSAVWTDAELQQVADYHRIHIRREFLEYDVDQQSYFSKFGNLEGTYITDQEANAVWDNDATIIKMWDSNSSSATAITPIYWNLADGSFGFTSDQDDEYYLDAKSYDLHGAAAELFEELSADSSRAYRWVRGSVSHTAESFLDLAKYHRSLSGPQSLEVRRTYRTEVA